MPDRQINNLVLDAICIDLKSSKLFYFQESTFYFEDLYATGCRSTELLRVGLWSQTEQGWRLQTLKTGEFRTFEDHELSAHWKLAFLDGVPPYGGLSYDQLTGEFRRSVLVGPIYAGNRIADTYLFRYNRARRFFDETKDLKALMAYMGWSNEVTAHKYLTTPLINDPFRNGGL